MDMALFGTSACLAVYLPRVVFPYQSAVELSSMAVSLGLSLGLFSLSLLEAVPVTWLMVLSSSTPSLEITDDPSSIATSMANHEDYKASSTLDTAATAAVVVDGWLSIARVYWLLLWALSLVILVAFPCLAGVAVAETFGNECCFLQSSSASSSLSSLLLRDTDDEHRKKYPFLIHYWRSWCPWWIRFFCGLFKIVIKNMWKLICRPLCCSNKSTTSRHGNNSISINNNTNNTNNRSNETINLTISMSGDGDEQQQLCQNNSNGEVELGIRPSSSAISPISNGIVHSNNNSHHHPYHNNYHHDARRFLTSLGSICGVSVVLVMVSTLGPIVVKTPSDKTALSVIVSWLCAIGLMISSVLNGFGSVSMPYSCLAGLFLKPVRPEVIASLEMELKNVLETLGNKRVTLREMTMAISTTNNKPRKRPNSTTSSTTSAAATAKVNKLRSFSGLGDELVHRKQIIQTEINFLEILCKEMMEDLEELRHSQKVAAAARTTFGKFQSYVGLVFSVVLLVRLLASGMIIWKSYTIDTSLHKVVHEDVVTKALLWLSGHEFVSNKHRVMLSQIVSLGLTAVLSVSQIRTFLRTVAVIHSKWNRFFYKCNNGCGSAGSNNCNSSGGGGSTFTGNNMDHSLHFYPQIIAGASGCYFLSCIVLIKMMLPEEFCQGFSNAMGGMDVFTIHTSVVNTVFVWTAGVSASVLGMLFGIQRQNNFRHVSNDNSTTTTTVFRGADAC